MNRKQRSINSIIRILIFVLLVLLLGMGMEHQPFRKAAFAWNRILSGAEFTLQKAAAGLICPGLLYTAKEPGPGTVTEDPLISLAWELFPVYYYVHEKEQYETTTESSSFYELLLVMDTTQIRERQKLEEQMEVENQEALQKQQEESVVETETEQPETAEEDPVVFAEEAAETFPGVDYGREELADYEFVRNSFYTVASSTSIGPEVLDGVALSEMDLNLQNDGTEPQILIYHTHSQEGFSDSVEGDLSTTIVGVGDYLTEILREQYGYNVIHNTSVYDRINGELDRNQAYSLALPEIQAILQQYPSIEVVLDLHRDGVDENLHLVTEVDGKPAARIMFVNGLSYSARNGPIDYLNNPYISENLAFSMQMKLACEKYFPGFTRKNYLNSLRYNLHVLPRSLLVEAGAQTNTLEEVKNAMEPLAYALHKVIGNGR